MAQSSANPPHAWRGRGAPSRSSHRHSRSPRGKAAFDNRSRAARHPLGLSITVTTPASTPTAIPTTSPRSNCTRSDERPTRVALVMEAAVDRVALVAARVSSRVGRSSLRVQLLLGLVVGIAVGVLAGVVTVMLRPSGGRAAGERVSKAAFPRGDRL